MYEAVGIGVSAGGLGALAAIVPQLPPDYPLAVIIVQHRAPESGCYLAEYLTGLGQLPVREATAGEAISAPCAYIAPAGYHLLVERDKTFSLSIDLPVCFAIPSVDVLLTSCANSYGPRLVGVILTGANSDGSKGLVQVKAQGGMTVVQDPATAESTAMPNAAIAAQTIDHILPLDRIGSFLADLAPAHSPEARR